MLKRLLASEWFYYSVSILLGLGIVAFNHIQAGWRTQPVVAAPVPYMDASSSVPLVRRIEIRNMPGEDK